MTGINNIYQGAKNTLRHSWKVWRQLIDWLPASVGQKLEHYLPKPRWDIEDEDIIAQMRGHVPIDVRQCREMGRDFIRLSGVSNESVPPIVKNDVIHTKDSQYRWGLLLPISSRGLTKSKCDSMLKQFKTSLFESTTAADRDLITIYMGIDKGDLVYDAPDSTKMLAELFKGVKIKHHPLFEVGYRGKLCWIWDKLAQYAVRDGADFVVLLGDDVELKTSNWKREIEEKFLDISHKRNLPFGIACVAFQDTAFPVFPTFPVIHRRHILEVYQGNLFPPEFMNQHGDPFLFEIYRRWGASEFADTAQLKNTVGGKDCARYLKHNVCEWRDTVLSKALSEMDQWLASNSYSSSTAPHTDGLRHQTASAGKFLCLDVVCPTYRCELNMLERIVALRTDESYHVSTQFLLVVDNPQHPNLQDIINLQRYGHEKGQNGVRVRVHVNKENVGASESRNKGRAQCFADYAVLLDDDIIPDTNLLNAYYGGIKRYPDAKVWVGVTKLPRPQSLMQHALYACKMTFFYDIAERKTNPPWGVTSHILDLSHIRPSHI
jgi:hypothetical protein